MHSEHASALRQIPQIDRLLNAPALAPWKDRLNADVRRRLAQYLVERVRDNIDRGASCPSLEELSETLRGDYEKLFSQGLRRAINATGIVLHTNLGRAPLARSILDQMAEEVQGYCTLEMDTQTAIRGHRSRAAEKYLYLLTGCEASLVVNNNAGAVFLILHALARGREVLISRGEIVQIGGGFRLPDIFEATGAKLVEVGTTNITQAKDYKTSDRTAMILRVHQSNFSVRGHTQSPSLEALAKKAREAALPLVVDLGSGSLEDRNEGEVSIQRVLASGADLVCFSGDKLFGSSQAGIVVGKSALIAQIRQSPVYRALRLGKFDLYLLEQTLRGHLQNHSTPVKQLLDAPLEELKGRAQSLCKRLQQKNIPAQVVAGEASIGGGTTPDEVLPTFLVEVSVEDSSIASRKLAQRTPSIHVRRSKGKIGLDLRTVFPDEEMALIEGVACLF